MGNPAITIVGRIGTNITTRVTGNGEVVRFRVVTNDRKKNESGEWEDKNTSGWNIACWDKLGEKVKAHLEKGDPVIVVGRIFDDNWTDDEGNARSSKEVRADHVGLNVALAKA